MKHTDSLIVGASISGLASAACLQKQGIDYLIIEKHSPTEHLYQFLEHLAKFISPLFFRFVQV